MERWELESTEALNRSNKLIQSVYDPVNIGSWNFGSFILLDVAEFDEEGSAENSREGLLRSFF